MDLRPRLFAGLLLVACTHASARPLWHIFHHHSKPAAAPAAAPAYTGPVVSATPIVRRDYGKHDTTAMDSSNRLVPTADLLIQSEEELDRLRLEHDDLLSRVQSLESQLRDQQQLLKLKQKQIHELEAQLKQKH
jgi:hypothetical protein